jgi:peptide/nickel transport system permease protein
MSAVLKSATLFLDPLRRRAASAYESEFVYQLLRSPMALTAAITAALFVVGALFAPWIAPHTPFDPATVSLIDALMPPAWLEGGDWSYPLGTDGQGRCILSTLLYGSRVSLFVGVMSVGIAAFVGMSVGLLCGWAGGRVDTILMRAADIQMSLPDIMLALLISGIARVALPRELHDALAVWILIFAIAASNWPQFARVVRASTLSIREREFVHAARVFGVSPLRIVVGHVVPNVMGPVVVIATIGFAFSILAEAALSYVGVGVPPTQPTLGALIRIGNNYLFSGEWWISLVPAFTLLVLALSVNIFGDWLRDVLNPRRR